MKNALNILNNAFDAITTKPTPETCPNCGCNPADEPYAMEFTHCPECGHTPDDTDSQVENPIFKQATIDHFDAKKIPGKLIVYFIPFGSSSTYRAFAHPAMAHRLPNEELSPIARLSKEKRVMNLEVTPTDEGWKFYECLIPSDERKASFAKASTEPKAQRETRTVSKADVKAKIDF